jgi:hypothetical protein
VKFHEATFWNLLVKSKSARVDFPIMRRLLFKATISNHHPPPSSGNPIQRDRHPASTRGIDELIFPSSIHTDWGC